MRVLSDLISCSKMPGMMTVEASTIGLKPGEWPAHIDVYNEGTGETVRFIRVGLVRAGEDVGYVNYMSKRVTLRVFND